MTDYIVEVFDDESEESVIMYKTSCADGYCAEVEARRKYPKAKIGKVKRIENIYDSFTEEDYKNLGNNY